MPNSYSDRDLELRIDVKLQSSQPANLVLPHHLTCRQSDFFTLKFLYIFYEYIRY